MKSYLVYKKEWYADSSYEATKSFTYDVLRQLYHLLDVQGGTELGHLVTGLDDDTYSDGLVKDLEELYYQCGEDRKETIRRALEDDVICTYETYHRCLNICGIHEYDQEPESLEKQWIMCLNIEIDNWTKI